VPNPWLAVSLAEYEGHMAAPGVRQLAALSDLFAEALAYGRPESVAILGVAGGNGLERIDSRAIRRVVGLDVNPSYLDAVRERHDGLRGLELHCADLSGETLALAAVELVHAALIFEHAGLDRCLDNALALAVPGGALSAVLQLPGDSESIAPSASPAIRALKPRFSLIDPARFRETLGARGFRLAYQTRRPLPEGKAFWMGIFRHAP